MGIRNPKMPLTEDLRLHCIDGAEPDCSCTDCEAAREIERLTAEGTKQKRAFDDLLTSAETAIRMLCDKDRDTRNDAVPYLRNRIYQAKKDSGRQE